MDSIRCNSYNRLEMVDHYVLPMMLCLMLLVSGCVSTQQSAPSHWTCDAQADAAVSNQDWEAARKAHELVLANHPANCLALYHQGYIQGQLGDRTREVAFYQQALECGYVDNDQLYFNLGMALGDRDDLDGALDAFEQAVALAPQNADNHFGRGLMAQAAGRQAQAEDALLRTVALDPDHWEARLLLAQTYLDQSRWDDARFQLEAVLTANSSHPEALDLWQTMISRQRESYDTGSP